MINPTAIRKAVADDANAMAGLIVPYLRETYSADWGGNEKQLAEDIADGKVSVFVADKGGKAIGFAAFVIIYDLHWCVRGGEVVDIYVTPEHRGHGVALQILAAIAADVHSGGGVFLKGGAVENVEVRRFYARATITQGNGECYLSGRAFRHVTGLAGRPVRHLVRNMPDPAWNLE